MSMQRNLLDTLRRSTNGLYWSALLLVVFAIAPAFLYPVFLMNVMCYALFAAAYNLVFGYAGLLAFGHAAFFGAAAYVTGYVARDWHLDPLLAVLAGAAVAAVLGFTFGALAIRRTGLYFAMITFALAQLVYFAAVQFPWTGGEDGLQSVPRGVLLGLFNLNDPVAIYVFVLAVFLVSFAILYRVVHSPFGHVLTAVRENEPRAVSLGYDVNRYKILAFTLSATFSGVAGGLKTIIFQLASLSDVHFTTSSDALLMVLMGGIGTVMGPIVGGVVLVTMQLYLATLGSWVTFVQGAVFVLFVLLLRKGLVGNIEAWLKSRSLSSAK